MNACDTCKSRSRLKCDGCPEYDLGCGETSADDGLSACSNAYLQASGSTCFAAPNNLAQWLELGCE